MVIHRSYPLRDTTFDHSYHVGGWGGATK
jgi:hypothetical protein